ncbi:hypothetical protein VNI00_000528 [Paramarasmius palmivorus]|uniref:Uncharacterized protein n=1 Tax=Paramarasmius palmivorus TaxID=297713 RepID=A0AAW0E949_9AGAR
MVVNKKRPNPPANSAAPSGMGSRTSSSQPLPKATKHTTKDRQEPTALTKNTKNQKNSAKTKSKKKKSSAGWLDTFLLFTLSVFTLYAFSTCPSDTTLHNPLCRSLSQYKTHILDPYVIPQVQEHIIPPIQRVLEHPNIHLTVVRLQEAQRRVAPYAEAAKERIQPHVVRAVDCLLEQVERVWEVIVVPRYQQWIQPHIQPYLDLLQHKFVEPYLQPFLHKSTLYLHFVANKLRQASPHVDRAVSLLRQYSHVIYVRVKPHALQAWESLKPLAIKAGEQIGELRRIYVDPHVWRIWEKVVELSGSTPGENVSSTTTTEAIKSSSGSSDETRATVIEETSTTSTFTEIEVLPTTASTVAEVPTPEIPEEPVLATSTESSSSSSVTADQAAETLESASSVVAASASISPSSTPEKEAEVRATIAPAEPEPASSPSASETASAASTETEVADDDLESFLSGLGLNENEPAFDDPPPPPVFTATPDGADAAAPPQTVEDEETEEEKAEKARIKKEEVAAKRKRIEDRHTAWEEKLLQRIVGKMTETVQFLEVLRDVAAGEILGKNVSEELAILELYTSTRPVTHIDDLPVKGLLDTLEKEGDKLLSGLEGWVKREEKAGKPGADQKAIDEKLRKWTQVVTRVEDRFQEKVTELRSRVHNWYREVREMEVNECLAASGEIKGIASDAQADIGLDYAWLEDVTYDDWQRYHDLMRAYEGFDKDIREVQAEVDDPLVPALDELQKELDDLVAGFNIRVRTIKGRGRSVVTGEELEFEVTKIEVEGDKGVTEKQKFDETPVGNVLDTEKESEPIAIGSIPLKEPVQATEGTSAEDPTFSILPIEEEAVKVDPAQVVIGKSSEQVEQAIKILEESEARHREEL